MEFYKNKVFIRFSFVLWSLLFAIIAYIVPRTSGTILLSLYAVISLVYFYFITHFNDSNWWFIIPRIVFLFSIPSLSDDVYRFIWDGKLSNININPYLYLPSDSKSFIPANYLNSFETLFKSLNSPNYYSVYPPINQGVFFIISSAVFKTTISSIIALRLILISFDLATIVVINKICFSLGFSGSKTKKILTTYALNPLILLEISANLHFEGMMLFFIFVTVYFLVNTKPYLAAICLGLAINCKLVPLIFLPSLIKTLGIKKGLSFCLVVFLLNITLFSVLWDEQILHNIGSSLSLYFQNFEFNASIYFILRKLGFLIVEYNLISIIGKVSAVLVLLLIVKISFKNFLLIDKWILSLFVYLSFATTVHPWYIIPLFGLSLFGNFKFPLVWTCTIFLSYLSYTEFGVNENSFVLLLEYVPVFVLAYWEISTLQNVNNEKVII